MFWLASAEATMRRGRIHRLPVVDEADWLLGVISLALAAIRQPTSIGASTE